MNTIMIAAYCMVVVVNRGEKWSRRQKQPKVALSGMRATHTGPQQQHHEQLRKS